MGVGGWSGRAAVGRSSSNDRAGTVAAIGVPIDCVVTAEQARADAPDHRLVLHADATLGVTEEETVHVARGPFADLKVCDELGIRSVSIDRAGEPLNPGWPPHAPLDDPAGSPDMLSVSETASGPV